MTLELSLNNFRCWEEKTLSIPSSGICLINARSGRGKSSILNSILYAITGKLKNISTINKKSTKVTIKMENIIITRSRGPNRLSIEKEGKLYENDEAQGIINSIFGSEFSNTSYIDQENTYSFVFLSPSDKMEFLEKLLLQDYNIDKIKDTVRSDISKTKNDYSIEESKNNTLETILLSSNQDSKEIDELYIDKVKITRNNYDKILEKVKSNQDISEKNIKILKTKVKKLEDEQSLYVKTNEKIASLKFLIEDIKNNPLYNDIHNIEDMKTSLKCLEESKKFYINNKEFINNSQKHDELIVKLQKIEEKNKTELSYLQTELNNIKGVCFSKKKMSDLEKCLIIIDDISFLEEQIENKTDFDSLIQIELNGIEKNRDLLTEYQKILLDLEKSYTCPSCNSNLKINENKLVLSTIVSKSDPLTIKKEIEVLKSSIKKSDLTLSEIKRQQTIFQQKENQYNELFDQLDSLRGDVECSKEDLKKEIDMIKKHIEISEKIQAIKDDKVVKDIKLDISYIFNKINKCDKQESSIKTEQDYIECLSQISSLHEKISQIKSLSSKINSSELELSFIQESSPSKNCNEILKSEREKLDNYNSKNDTYKSYIDKLAYWEREIKEEERKQSLKKSIEESSKNKQYLSNRLRCLVKLREHIKNAEQQCISEFIESLNQHASIYIEQFFPDEDIKVELKTIQETKSTGKEKISLNFDLSYRQINGDLSYLSGGERDRVNLAFTLAFSEIINNRILLLDECISSLDAETTNIVLENLKEKYKGKLVILVSHQANQGFFDKVIDL